MAQARVLDAATNLPLKLLPQPIRAALARMERRLRWVSILRGVGLVGLVAAIGMVVGMGLDFAFALHLVVRLAIWGVWVVALLVLFSATVVKKLAARDAGTSLDLAALIERQFPKVGERITAAVGLVGSAGPSHGSPELIAAIVDEAVVQLDRINPVEAVPSRSAGRWFWSGLGALSLLAIPLLVVPDPLGALGMRFLNPWADLGRISRIQIDVDPGDTFAAIGNDLPIQAEIRARFGTLDPAEAVWLEWVDPTTKRTRRITMSSPSTDPQAIAIQKRTATIPSLADSLTYRVVTKTAESDRFQVSAIEPPRIARVSVKIVPAAYTKRPPVELDNPSRIDAFEASKIEFKVTAASKIKAIELRWPKPDGAPNEFERQMTRVNSSGLSATGSFLAEVSGPVSILLHDPRGIQSRPDLPRSVKVVADAPPALKIEGVDGLNESSAEDTLRLGVSATDDVAVASVELHYAIVRNGKLEAPETGKVDAKFKGIGTDTAQGVVTLGLRSLDLKPGDAITYKVRVADNRPAPKGPNITWSSDQDLKIVEKVDSMSARRSQAEREAVKQRLEAAKKAINDVKKETEQLRYAADAANRGNGQWQDDRKQSLIEQEAAAQTINNNLQLLATELEDDATFHPLSRASQQIAEVEGEAMRAALDRARLAQDPAKRFNELQKADARINDVNRKIDDLQRDFDNLTKQGEQRDRLQDLADRQDQIADRAENARLDPSNRASFDRLQAEQNSVRNELDSLLQKTPDLRAKLLGDQAIAAESLAKKAKDLADRQRQEASRATNLSDKATMEKLQAIADEQRTLENETRRFAIDVNQGLVENARGQVNTDPLKRAIEPIERGDINEWRERLRESERELLRLARDIKDVPQDPKALARRLFNTQQQISNDLAQTLGEHRTKGEIPAAVKPAIEEMLKKFEVRAGEVARLAAAIPESKEALALPVNGGQPFPRDLATKAAEAAKRSLESLRAAKNPQEMERQAVEARELMNNLVNAMPDHWKREEERRRAFDEGRRKADHAANEVERHLREMDRPNEGQNALNDLATRLTPHADEARKGAEDLAKIDPGLRSEDQRDRALKRARELANAVEATRAAIAKKPGANEAQALRDALQLAAIRSRIANERLNQSLHGMPTDDTRADDLAKSADKSKQFEAKSMMSSLRGLQAPDAPIEKAEALRAFELAASNSDPKSADALNQAAKQAIQALADRLNDRQTPRNRAQMLARAERSSSSADDPTAAARRQRDVAAELASLPLEGDPSALNAVQNARNVAEALAKPADPGEVRPVSADLVEAQNQAARVLEAVAAKLPVDAENVVGKSKERPGKDLPVDPALDLNADHAKIATDLAQRERQLADRLQAVLGERAEPQAALRREAMALGREFGALRERSQSLSERSRGPSQEAANLLTNDAPRTMKEAETHLGEGQKDRARDMQRQSSDIVERAARSAEDLANALLADKASLDAQARADGKALAEPSQSDAEGKALAQAREAMNQAAGKLQGARSAAAEKASAASAAKQALRDAANSLQAAAEAQAQARASAESKASVAQQSKAASARDPKGGKVSPGTAETLSDLQALVQKKTGRSWGELPGHLRTEILEMARQPRYRDDYARLIQLYFRDIAAGAK